MSAPGHSAVYSCIESTAMRAVLRSYGGDTITVEGNAARKISPGDSRRVSIEPERTAKDVVKLIEDNARLRQMLRDRGINPD